MQEERIGVCFQEAVIASAAIDPEKKGFPGDGHQYGSLKGNKGKQLEEGEKRGRKTNKQRIVEIGTRLIESGNYSMIKEAFK